MKTVRLKYLTKEPLQYGLNIEAKHYSDDGIRFLRTTDINDSGEIKKEGVYLRKEIVPENYLLKKGDVLFSRSGTIGRCYFHQSDKTMTYAGFLVRFRLEDIELAKWVYYYSKTPIFNITLHSQAIESTIKNFNGQKFNNIAIPFNHLQLTINNYLDSQVKKIKTFITKKQTFIKLLKEQRQSVIDNLLINKRKKVKIKYCVSKIGGGVTPKGGATVYKESGVIFLRSQNVYNDGLRLGNVACISEEIHFSMKGSQVKKNDVLINVTGASIGRCFTYLLDNEANVNQHVTIIRPNLSILYPKFLMLQLQSNRIQHQIDMIEGASREGLTKNDIQNYYLYLPTLKEQSQIITHIKTETSKIDQAISKSEKEIELIQEYQKAMIAEAVLGKI